MPGWFNRAGTQWLLAGAAPVFEDAVLHQLQDGVFCLFVAPDSGIAINGSPAAKLGVHVLVHKDEIRRGDGSVLYFTSEALPEVISISGQKSKCGRCRALIEESKPAVRCICGVSYHHGDPSCFEYGEHPVCVACHRPTRLDGSGLWCPEEES
jgi:hypothetical protein